MRKLPDSLKRYFWDINPSELDIDAKSEYVSERLLEYGNPSAIKWVLDTYGVDFAKNIVKDSKNLSKKSANYYSLIFGINKEDILCLQPEFQTKHRAIWNY